jgi:hypothetical protein
MVSRAKKACSPAAGRSSLSVPAANLLSGCHSPVPFIRQNRVNDGRCRVGRLRETAAQFAFTMAIGLIGSSVIFGISALVDLPGLVGALGGGSAPRIIGLLFLLVLTAPVVFVVWLVRKVGERHRQSAE